MGATMSKGKRRERQAAEIYEAAGWRTFRPQESPYGETDIFGLYDMVAIHPNRHTDWVQVKATNTGRGAQGVEAFAEASTFLPANNTAVYLVCYDREGWRWLWCNGGDYDTEVDERELDCRMGEGVTEYLRTGRSP